MNPHDVRPHPRPFHDWQDQRCKHLICDGYRQWNARIDLTDGQRERAAQWYRAWLSFDVPHTIAAADEGSTT